MATPSVREPRDNFVDYARLFLAASVCLLHIHGSNHIYLQGAAIWAVPAFLAISGYYILRSYEHSSGWPEFIKKRLLRIGPAFAISFVLVAIANPSNVVQTLRFYVTLGQSNQAGIMNAPVWSLGVEEVAYAVLAILFTLGAYKAKWPIWCALLISAALGTIADAAWHPGHPQPAGMANVIPAFFAGSLIYIYREKLSPPKYLGLLLIAVALAYPAIAPESRLPIGWLDGLALGTGIILLRALRLPRIPDVSYGVYIYHAPLFLILGLQEAAFIPALGIFCLASWFAIEKPILRLKSIRQNPPATLQTDPSLTNRMQLVKAPERPTAMVEAAPDPPF
jgi:peptidoglycan/LPS O-acetylase OafA/YrhL